MELENHSYITQFLFFLNIFWCGSVVVNLLRKWDSRMLDLDYITQSHLNIFTSSSIVTCTNVCVVRWKANAALSLGPKNKKCLKWSTMCPFTKRQLTCILKNLQPFCNFRQNCGIAIIYFMPNKPLYRFYTFVWLE